MGTSLINFSLIATCAMALTIPMSIAADVFWKHKTYHPIFIMGAIPMFCSFFVIVLLTHYQVNLHKFLKHFLPLSPIVSTIFWHRRN